nr:hypothetical protein [Trentepohlia sp. YN1317]
MFLVKTLAAENKIPLITQSASLLFKDSRKLNDSSTVKDPIQVFFDKVKTTAPCICFLNDLDSIGEQRHMNIEKATSEVRTPLPINSNETSEFFSNKILFGGSPITKILSKVFQDSLVGALQNN